MSVVEGVWTGRGALASAMRTALAPLSAAFGAVVSYRNRRFDRGEGVQPVALPVLSVGNLTVGGTGKTPVAAWCAKALRDAGGHPAIVLRGYGDDEWRVHELLSPGVPVVTDADRVRAIAEARTQGADCAVLDDGFQHRRAYRNVDLVLVSADAWDDSTRLLPAGPWREPLTSLRRASLIVITVKSASADRVRAAEAAVQRAAPQVPRAVVDIVPAGLQSVPAGSVMHLLPGELIPLSTLANVPVLAVSAIGNPEPFERSLQAAGAIVAARRFADHHAFSPDEVASLVAGVPASGRVVCTLKDAVKLAPLWSRATVPLWYVSQSLVVRYGAEALDGAVQRILAARDPAARSTRPTAG